MKEKICISEIDEIAAILKKYRYDCVINIDPHELAKFIVNSIGNLSDLIKKAGK